MRLGLVCAENEACVFRHERLLAGSRTAGGEATVSAIPYGLPPVVGHIVSLLGRRTKRITDSTA
jgi:hypothetical protein